MEPEPDLFLLLPLLLLWGLPAELLMSLLLRERSGLCCLGCPGLLTAFEPPLAIATVPVSEFAIATILEFVVCAEYAECADC